jgi:transposase InsO family protein
LLKIKHLRTKPYTPKTNGKAERLVQTSLREWAYARHTRYLTTEPNICCGGFTDTIGTWPHRGPKSKPPISRLGLTEDNNLLRLHG